MSCFENREYYIYVINKVKKSDLMKEVYLNYIVDKECTKLLSVQ